MTANVLNWYMQLKGVSVSLLVHRSFCRFQTSAMFSKTFKSQTPDTAAEPRAVGGPVDSATLWRHGAPAGHTVTRYNTSLTPPPRAAGPTVPCAQLVVQAECERVRGGGAAEPTLPGGWGWQGAPLCSPHHRPCSQVTGHKAGPTQWAARPWPPGALNPTPEAVRSGFLPAP